MTHYCKKKRILIKTKVLTEKDDIFQLIEEYVLPHNPQKDDLLVISESPLAITQGRAIPEDKIKVGFLASILWKRVRKVPYGVGLRSPQTMQCAINEVGTIRILAGAIIGGITRFFGRRGDFYRIAGMQAALIDAPHTSPIPPYDRCVILGPKDPDKVAQSIHKKYGFNVAIMDINDIGGSWVIGKGGDYDVKEVEDVMRDNPQGQGDNLTPFCLLKPCD